MKSYYCFRFIGFCEPSGTDCDSHLVQQGHSTGGNQVPVDNCHSRILCQAITSRAHSVKDSVNIRVCPLIVF